MYENVRKDRSQRPSQRPNPNSASIASFASSRTSSSEKGPSQALPRQSSNPAYPAPYHAGNSVFYNRVNSETILAGEGTSACTPCQAFVAAQIVCFSFFIFLCLVLIVSSFCLFFFSCMHINSITLSCLNYEFQSLLSDDKVAGKVE